jgi:hypothetical protein
MGWAWRLDIFGGCDRLVAGSSYSPEPNQGQPVGDASAPVTAPIVDSWWRLTRRAAASNSAWTSRLGGGEDRL